MNNKDSGSKNKCELKCCNAGDYYIKHTGYKYYSIEKCVKVEVEGILADFWAYEYTDELNDSLIGQKKELPYGFCHAQSLFLAVNDNVVKEGKSVYHRYPCGSGRKCGDGFDGLCIPDGVSIDGNKDFECAVSDNEGDAVFIKYKKDTKTIATCPTGTELKIKNESGKWSGVDCRKRLEFRIDEVRCAPIELSYDGIIPHPKS